MGVIPSSRCLPGCSWRVGSSAVPLVRGCAAGMGSVRSWPTWRRALTIDLSLAIVKTDRFPVRLARKAGSHRVPRVSGLRLTIQTPDPNETHD